MTNFKNPIPAILVHQDGMNEYRVSGKIYAINESNNTVSMKIKGRAGIEHDIPMESIYLTEGILDSIKKAGRAIAKGLKYLLRKIKGFLLPVDENGEVDYSFGNAPINLAALEARGELPPYVHFYPSADIVAEAEENGLEVANADIDPTDDIAVDDAQVVETYWSRVMKNYVANESFTISDAVKSVNESYVRRYNNAKKNAIRKGKLDEAVVSLHNPKYDPDKYGPEMGTEELISEAMANIEAQLTRGIGDQHVLPPILIWGAPGIGKTVILKGICDRMKEELGINLNFQLIQCANLNTEDWGIPALRELHGMNEHYATNVPKQWLPVYALTGDPEEDQRRDDVYNSGTFQNKNNNYDGGVIMFDELSRLPGKAKNNMMALVDQYKYEDMYMASKWCLIFASNRLEDVRWGEENEYVWEAAQSDRFTHVTFVPQREEWLNWARQKNKKTGRQNIDERFVAFIEQSPEGVWYDALDFGSRDNVLSDDDKKAVMNYSEPEDIETVLDNKKLKGQLGWTGRKWESGIMNNLNNKLNIIFRGHPELRNSIYDEEGNINSLKLEQALDMLSPGEWERWAKPYRKRLDPNGRMTRIAFYEAYLEEFIINDTFGHDTLPAREWRIYNEYKRTFTPPVVESIWMTGKMPAGKLEQDDNKYYVSAGDYGSTETSKWKANANVIYDVIDIIMNGYPGGYETAAKQIIAEDQFNNNTPMSPAEATKLFDKFQKEYTVTVGKDKIPTLFDNNDDPTNPGIQSILKSLANSAFARNLAHAAAYIAKTTIHNGSNSIIENAGKKWFNGLTGEFYQNIQKIDLKAYKEHLMHIEELKTVNNDKAARQSMVLKCLMAPAMKIIGNAGMRNKNFAKNGHY